MYLLGTKLLRDGSHTAQCSAHVHDNGDLLLEIGAAGEVTETQFITLPAAALPWLYEMASKAKRIVIADAAAPDRKFSVVEGGIGGTGVARTTFGHSGYPHTYTTVETPTDLPVRPGGGSR